jgi:hypothetical protein
MTYRAKKRPAFEKLFAKFVAFFGSKSYYLQTKLQVKAGLPKYDLNGHESQHKVADCCRKIHRPQCARFAAFSAFLGKFSKNIGQRSYLVCLGQNCDLYCQFSAFVYVLKLGESSPAGLPDGLFAYQNTNLGICIIEGL